MAAPSGAIVGWPSTAASIPAGWTRVAGMDSRMPRGNTVAGGTGGAATHAHSISLHTHATASHDHAQTDSSTGAVGTYGNTGPFGGTSTWSPLAHKQNFAVQPGTLASSSGSSSTASNLPNIYTVIWIQSDGSTNIPSGAIAWTALTSAPASWAFMDGSGASPDIRQYFLYGAATGADGGTQTARAAHTHTYSHNHAGNSHSHTGSLASGTNNAASTLNFAATAASGGHDHFGSASTGATAGNATGTDATASGSGTVGDPAYMQLNHVKSSAQVAAPTGLIVGFNSGTAPTGWALCDGTGGRPSLNGTNRCIIGATATGTTGGTGGGSDTHSHSISHTHTAPASHTHTFSGTSAGPSNTSSIESGAAINLASNTHTHTYNTSGASQNWIISTDSASLPATTTTPPYYDVVFIQKLAAGGGTRNYPRPVARGALRGAA